MVVLALMKSEQQQQEQYTCTRTTTAATGNVSLEEIESIGCN